MAELEKFTYPQTAQEIVEEIIQKIVFGLPVRIFNSDLRRLIIEAIEADRQRAKEWLDQQN